MRRSGIAWTGLCGLVIASLACSGGGQQAAAEREREPQQGDEQPQQEPPSETTADGVQTQEAPPQQAESNTKLEARGDRGPTEIPVAPSRTPPSRRPSSPSADVARRAPPPESAETPRSSLSEPAEPTPPAAPEPIVKTVPAGTTLQVVFLDGLSSETSKAGDSFRARVTQDILLDGLAVIPAGSVVVGSVTEAVPLKKIGGTAKLALEFSTLELTSGRTALISAIVTEQGKSETKKDAATIGGAAAGGAVLGRILSRKDRGKGTVIGAIVGAAAGTAIAAKSPGEQVEIPVGTELSLQLNKPAQVTVTL